MNAFPSQKPTLSSTDKKNEFQLFLLICKQPKNTQLITYLALTLIVNFGRCLFKVFSLSWGFCLVVKKTLKLNEASYFKAIRCLVFTFSCLVFRSKNRKLY